MSWQKGQMTILNFSILRNLLSQHFCPNEQNLGLKKPTLWGNLEIKLKFGAPNLQMSMDNLSEISSVCQKIATSRPAYYFNACCFWKECRIYKASRIELAQKVNIINITDSNA